MGYRVWGCSSSAPKGSPSLCQSEDPVLSSPHTQHISHFPFHCWMLASNSVHLHFLLCICHVVMETQWCHLNVVVWYVYLLTLFLWILSNVTSAKMSPLWFAWWPQPSHHSLSAGPDLTESEKNYVVRCLLNKTVAFLKSTLTDCSAQTRVTPGKHPAVVCKSTTEVVEPGIQPPSMPLKERRRLETVPPCLQVGLNDVLVSAWLGGYIVAFAA